MGVYKESSREKYATVGKDRYPIGDKAHARAALSRINQGNLSPAEKAKVRAKANRMLGKGRGSSR
jgi:hypothetical protein